MGANERVPGATFYANSKHAPPSDDGAHVLRMLMFYRNSFLFGFECHDFIVANMSWINHAQ